MSASPVLIEFDSLRHKWGWLLTLGIVMLILGTIALFITPAATIGTVIVLGWLLVISGVVELVQAFRVRKWTGIFLHLIGGILGILVGLLGGDSSGGGRTGVDAAVRFVFHRGGDFPSDRRYPVEVPSLEVGGFRWRGNVCPGASALGRVALVGGMVHRSGGGYFTGSAGMVLCDVCICHSQPGFA